MALKFGCMALGLLQVVISLPVQRANTLEDLMDDTMQIGSYIRETRAAAPDDYHKSKESEADGEIGYSRKKSGGGKRGYQHFDSFHKKAGDHYEIEKQDSFGLDDEGQDGAYSHNQERRAPKESESYDNEEERPKKQRQEKENRQDLRDINHEELKEGEADDGNGGVEASGHDPNDYILPEKYTYGDEDEEFKF